MAQVLPIPISVTNTGGPGAPVMEVKTPTILGNEAQASPPLSKVYEPIEAFDLMGLTEDLLRGIYGYGFNRPSLIQQKSIVPLREGRDVIGQAQSGTGKTGAFSIGALTRILPGRRYPQVLLVSPTRELAEQTYKVVIGLSNKMAFPVAERAERSDKFDKFEKASDKSSDKGDKPEPANRVVESIPLSVQLCIGGTNVSQDVRNLRETTHVVCGTPGRVLDLIQRRAINTNDMRIMIIDEADEMLSQGFKDQIYEIFNKLPNNTQIGLFSATLPAGVLELAKNFMRQPVEILIAAEGLTLEGIKQVYIELREEDWKFDTLMDLYRSLELRQTIVFVNTRRKCEWLAGRMRKQEYPVAEIHANLPAAERKQIMADFIQGATRVLLTTDLMARGIDVQQVSLIVNYDLPTSIENYIHRIGRSGRYGRKGLAINFVTQAEAPRLDELRRFYNTDIEAMPNDIQKFF